MTVPSMPMWSDCVASMPGKAPVRPRQKLPPPTTTATSTSSGSRTSLISKCGLVERLASSPLPDGPAKASPDGLKTMRFHGAGRTASADERPERNRTTARLAEQLLRRICFSSLAYGCSSRQISLKKPPMRPSTIFGDRRFGLALVSSDALRAWHARRPRPRRGRRPWRGTWAWRSRCEQRCRGRVPAIPPADFNEDSIHATTALDVQIVIKHGARGRLESAPHGRARCSP